MTVTVAERVERIGGVQTRVLEREGDGPPVLLLHGFADSADTWRPLMRAMERDERHLVAVDLPLFGRADRPSTQDAAINIRCVHTGFPKPFLVMH